MYYDEDLILELRLNLLNKHVHKFVVVESCYTHSGKRRSLKFDIKKYQKFKDKINYVIVEKMPNDIEELNIDDSENKKNSKILDNALKRENFQRNQISLGLKDASDNDLIIISDVDEIPNLENFVHKKKISIFFQKMFYYKFNLKHPTLEWVGSKACQKKNLNSPQWIRNTKSKKYPYWRLDVLFSINKHFNLNCVKDGGWHFTNIKSPSEIHYKLSNFLHHLEYEKSNTNLKDLKDLISQKKVLYDHDTDKKKEKWKSAISLIKVNDAELPEYLINNKSKYIKFFD